jgi:hypothetical protein
MKITMKKENTNEERKKLPKKSGKTLSVSPNRLPPIRSVYSVRIDHQRAQMLGFPQKIMEKIIKRYPLVVNETFQLEFELKDFEPGIIETFNMPKNHENYRMYKYLYDHRPKEEIIEKKLWAASEYIAYFLRKLGFELPTVDFEINSQKMIAHIEVKELEKVNKKLKKYKEKEFEEKILINFDTEEGKLYWINEKGGKFVCHLNVDSLPYKIIYFLAKEKNFVTTEELAEEYDKDKALIRSVISKLRKKLKQKLKIDGKKIIESIPSQGYRIRNVKIVEKPI